MTKKPPVDHTDYYSKYAASLSEQYNSVPFEQVHKDWLQYVPESGMALDIGAGSGRDARHLAAKGLTVFAVEPSIGIRERAQQYTVKENVHWLNDSLPKLEKVFNLDIKFDLILLSAVWMHVPPSERERCIRKISSLLKANGKIVISLRHGPCNDERIMYQVSADELATFAKQFGLTFKLLNHQHKHDELGRKEVSWQTVLLTLPDDGSGAFPLLRNIIMNDSKSSTYKVALLRTLLRIAEGHPGAVIERGKHRVALPLGLVALYWVRLFKPLVDHYEIPQHGQSRGLGFIKDSGWKQLTSYTASDFYIGAAYREAALAQAVFYTIKHAATLIEEMPVFYTTLPGSSMPIFGVEKGKAKRPSAMLTLDSSFLCSLGKFYVPTYIWDSLSRFSAWIEPSLVNEWVSLMEGYCQKRNVSFTKNELLEALSWENPKRSTSKIRRRVDDLLVADNVNCCWSGNRISKGNYAIDHAMPFARWPNNDLWNLLPTKTQINAIKSDKLPSSVRMMNSRALITEWWQQAWLEQQDEFFIQANLALPNLTASNRSFDEVFEAMTIQRDRIKDFQQLAEW